MTVIGIYIEKLLIDLHGLKVLLEDFYCILLKLDITHVIVIILQYVILIYLI